MFSSSSSWPTMASGSCSQKRCTAVPLQATLAHKRPLKPFKGESGGQAWPRMISALHRRLLALLTVEGPNLFATWFLSTHTISSLTTSAFGPWISLQAYPKTKAPTPSLPALISLRSLCTSHPVTWGRGCYPQSRLQSFFMKMWSGSLGYQIPFFITKRSNSPASFGLHYMN